MSKDLEPREQTKDAQTRINRALDGGLVGHSIRGPRQIDLQREAGAAITDLREGLIRTEHSEPTLPGEARRAIAFHEEAMQREVDSQGSAIEFLRRVKKIADIEDEYEK